MGDDPVTYQFEIERETWYDWTDTLPRRQRIDKRLEQLIEGDLRAARRDESQAINEKTARIFAQRIRSRCLHAKAALRDDDDHDAVVDQLEELVDIADTLDS